MIAVLSSVSQYRKSDSGRRNYSADKEPARPKKARRSIPVFYYRAYRLLVASVVTFTEAAEQSLQDFPHYPEHGD